MYKTKHAPPVGRDLGPHGVNLAEFCKRYNDATAGQERRIVPAEVTVYEDRSFDVGLKTPLTSALLREAAGIEKGAASPNGKPVSTVTREQLRRIAEIKLPDLNTASDRDSEFRGYRLAHDGDRGRRAPGKRAGLVAPRGRSLDRNTHPI